MTILTITSSHTDTQTKVTHYNVDTSYATGNQNDMKTCIFVILI